MKLQVSVIIPTYNRPDRLRACLLSLSLNPRRRDWEVIVVNDGGAISATVVEEFMDRLPLTYERVPHGGPAQARNHGARLARGRSLAFLDDDCEVPSNWLSQVLDSLGDHGAALMGGFTENALQRNCFASASQSLVNYLYEVWNCSDKQFFTSNNLVVPREGFWEIGGFDREFPLAAGEDRDLACRWHRSGRPLVFEPRLKVFHSHSMVLGSFVRQHFNYGRGAWIYWQRRSRLGHSSFRVEPVKFYLGMLSYPWRTGPSLGALRESCLIALTQIANAAGFFAAAMGQGSARPRPALDRVGRAEPQEPRSKERVRAKVS